MKRQLSFEFFDTKEAALEFEKRQPRHLRGAVTPMDKQRSLQSGAT